MLPDWTRFPSNPGFSVLRIGLQDLAENVLQSGNAVEVLQRRVYTGKYYDVHSRPRYSNVAGLIMHTERVETFSDRGTFTPQEEAKRFFY